jgi:hypothetical protein
MLQQDPTFMLHRNNPEIGTLGDQAEAAGLPANTVRIATLISSIYNKIFGKSSPADVQPATPVSPASEKPVALPAPSDDGIVGGINDISRMKDLAGIKKSSSS